MTLHFLHVLPDFGVGGVALRTVRIMNHLGPRCRHTVISLDGRTAAAERISEGITIELRAVQVDKRRRIGNLLVFRRCLADLAPDVMATYNWGAIEWAMVNRMWPVCRHIHLEAGFGLDEATRQFRRRVIARRFALAKAHSVVVPSRTLERIALDIWRLPRDHVRYIPDGIDVHRFSVKRYASLQAERPGQAIIIGTVAPLRPEKNIARLIEIFSRIA
jgi:L-malate glycosyltransferase